MTNKEVVRLMHERMAKEMKRLERKVTNPFGARWRPEEIDDRVVEWRYSNELWRSSDNE